MTALRRDSSRHAGDSEQGRFAEKGALQVQAWHPGAEEERVSQEGRGEEFELYGAPFDRVLTTDGVYVIRGFQLRRPPFQTRTLERRMVPIRRLVGGGGGWWVHLAPGPHGAVDRPTLQT